MKRKLLKYYFVVLLLLFSCGHKNEKTDMKRQSDYTFRLPESDLFLTTSKRENAQFYIIVSKDSLAVLSDSIDFIKFKTGDMYPINMVIDPQKKAEIYVAQSYGYEKSNLINDYIFLLNDSSFWSSFFEKQVKTEPSVLKYPYIHITIFSPSYMIICTKYEKVDKLIKVGNSDGW
jgi:hypothetical protein